MSHPARLLPDSPSAVTGVGGYPSPARAWYTVFVLTLACAIAFVDRQVLTLMVGPIRRDLALTDTQLSLLMGFAFAVCYSIAGLPAGRVADSCTRRTLIGASIATWSLLTAASGLARTYGHLLLCRLGIGLGQAGLSPAAYSLISDCFPPGRRSTALSVYAVGVYLGSGLAFILGSVAIQLTSGYEGMVVPLLGEMRPWQLVLLILGLSGLPVALLLASIREPVRQESNARHAGGSVPLREVWTYFRDNRTAFLCHHLGLACISLVGYGAASWIPTFFIRRFHWSAAQAGLAIGMIVVFGGTCGVLAGGRLADWLRQRGHTDANLRVALLGVLAWLPFGVFYPLASDVRWAVALLGPATLFGSMPFGVGSAGVQQMVPNRLRGQASAVYLLVVGLVGLGIGPTAVALLTDRVFGDDQAIHLSLFVVSVGGHLAAAVLLWRGLKPFRRTLAYLHDWRMPPTAARPASEALA